MKNKAKVAVIGLGNIGTVVATNLAKGRRSIIIADRKLEKAKRLAEKLGSLATPATISDALRDAEIIVLAVWFDAIKEIFTKYTVELSGKIIVDPSNPIAPDENGGFKKIIDKDQSAGEILSSLLPKNAKLAKALGTLGVGSLSAVAFQQPLNVLFYATDDRTIDAAIEDLITDSGFQALRVGELSDSIRIEVFGELHEFGALGKPVQLAQAQEKLVL